MIATVDEVGATLGVAPTCAALGLSRETYYRRLRPRVSGCHRPPTRALGVEERNHASTYTELAVTVTAEGALQTLEVTEPSGLQFLDEEAVAAVRGAPPFPPPPQGVIDRDGILRFRFGFWFDAVAGSTHLSCTKPADEHGDRGPGQRDAR